ncbi:MAG: hypothetical protein AAB739_04065 [Patescibacteria group bacterium]
MITEQEKLDKGNSGKQYLERSDEKLGLLELLISAIRDAINAAQNFHPHAFIRLAEKNEFGIHPYSLLYWWSLKETDLQAYRRQITGLRLEGRYDVDNLEAAVEDHDQKRIELKRTRLGLRIIK